MDSYTSSGKDLEELIIAVAVITETMNENDHRKRRGLGLESFSSDGEL